MYLFLHEKISKGVTPPDAILKVFALMSYFLPEAKMFPISDTDNMTFRDPIKGKMVCHVLWILQTLL